MRWTLVSAFLRRRLRSPLHLGLALLVPLFHLAVTLSTGSITTEPLSGSWLVVLLVGGGAIGEDLAAGSLVLVLARPVARWEVVVSTASGIAMAAFAVSLVTTAAVLLAGAACGAPDMPSPGEVAALTVESASVAVGGGAVMTVFGLLGRGVAGVALWGAAILVPQAAYELLGAPPVGRVLVRGFVRHVVMPRLDSSVLVGFDRIVWPEVISFALGTCLCLLAASALLCRKELPDGR